MACSEARVASPFGLRRSVRGFPEIDDGARRGG
jgi:hypothetical protein